MEVDIGAEIGILLMHTQEVIEIGRIRKQVVVHIGQVENLISGTRV
jgi:hypothetical protein